MDLGGKLILGDGGGRELTSLSSSHFPAASVWELLFWTAVLVMLVTAAVFIAAKIRLKTLQQEPTASELLSKLGELHSRGELSDAEFRTIKTTLAAHLQRQAEDGGKRA